MPRAKVRSNRAGDLLAFMSKHVGSIFSINDLMAEMQYPTAEYNATSQALIKMHEQGLIQRPAKGSYTYRGFDAKPEPQPVALPKLYEYVGTFQNGDIIVKGEDDGIYKLERL